MAERQLTQEYVRSLFEYEPETGVLTWKERPREHFSSDRIWKSTNTRCAGKATSVSANSDGYQQVGIDGKSYKAHRIIWLYMEGRLPPEVDHENGNRLDGRWLNLLASDRETNMKNKGIRKDNKSGVCGVGWHKTDRRWVAFITVSGKQIRLGGFTDKNAAIAARLEAENVYGFSEGHGKRLAHS